MCYWSALRDIFKLQALLDTIGSPVALIVEDRLDFIQVFGSKQLTSQYVSACVDDQLSTHTNAMLAYMYMIIILA